MNGFPPDQLDGPVQPSIDPSAGAAHQEAHASPPGPLDAPAPAPAVAAPAPAAPTPLDPGPPVVDPTPPDVPPPPRDAPASVPLMRLAPTVTAAGATLAIDIGGTGLKASVLDHNARMETARVRVATTYPMPPARLVSDLVRLVAPLPPYERISAGFPGVVRGGRVITAPHFVTGHGPGTKPDRSLVRAWAGFDLARALSQALGHPTRVANDADLQGSAVISGKGLELVMTLGTGVGTGLFWEGHLAPHLEIAQHPLAKGETYNGRLGEAARKSAGNKQWRKRVLRAIDTLHTLLNYDHLYIGGGNSARLRGHVGDDVTIVANDAGILGGIKLWEGDIL